MNRATIDRLVQRSLDAFADPPGAALIATSGGLDSTVLARVLVPALQARGSSPRLACFDHGWRPFDAELDHVRDLARELAVPLHRGATRPDPSRRRAVGPEAEAREARHRWLGSLAAGPIYLGHHADDQVENVLLHGVAMAARRGVVRRPLLGARRQDLLDLATASAWPWIEDPTNADLARPRNRLRHGALPALGEPGSRDALVAQGREELERRTKAEALATAAIPTLLQHSARGRHVLDRDGLAALPSEVITAAVRSLCPGPGRGPSAAALSALLDAVGEGAAQRCDLGRGWIATVSPSTVELLRPPSPPPARRALGPGEDVLWPTVGRLLRRRLRAARPGDPRLGRSRALIADPERALWLTPAGRGRRIRPFGLAGTRPVSELLREAGVSPARRSTWPLVVDEADRVLWIPGVRASAHAPLPPGGADATLLLFTNRTDRS